MKTKIELENIALQEAGLSRIWKQTLEYDIALISACRTKCINCIYPQKDKEEGGKYTPAENKKRTRLLRAKLFAHHFGVTAVDGGYIESNGTPFAEYKGEDSFFVVNLKNDPNFKDKLIELGKEFCQDSVWIKEKNDDFYLYGTNYASEPGLGNRLHAGEKFLNDIGQIFISKLKHPPYPLPEQIRNQINSKNPNTPLIEDFFEHFIIHTYSGQKVKQFSIYTMWYFSLISKDNICYK
ncbi:MAG: hypothetical protein LC107_11810 [Chitinophagales bacterium]|nr:hypothetical protein [Chitinophagales bacterium]